MVDPAAALRALGGLTDFGATTLPNIPQVPNSDDPALNNILTSMKQWMEQAMGSGLTGLASKQDLINAGVLKTDSNGNIINASDLSIPPVPTGLMANGAMTNILVQWDDPTGKYGNHAYTEVWAAEANDFSGAVMVGQSPGFVFSHAVGEDSARYYWIRFVSTVGIKGPFNAVTGTKGNTAQNVNYLIDTLTEAYGTNSAAPFFQVDTAVVINGVTVPPGTYMKSAFIADGQITTAQIKNATIDSAKITGKLTAAQINADQLVVTNGSFSGSLVAATGTFLGELVAATGTFSGRLMAGVIDLTSLTGVTEYRSAPGEYYFTLSDNESMIRYQLMAGGGGGGSGHGGEWNVNAGGGGGGGAGQYISGTLTLAPGAQIRVIVGSGGVGAQTWATSGTAGTHTRIDYWNGSSWVTLVYANPGQGGSAAPFETWDNQDGVVKNGYGGSGYPSGETAPWGNVDSAPARGGKGATTVWGIGGSPGWPNYGWGSSASGYGAGGGGGSGYHAWRNTDSAWDRSKYGGGGSGAGGRAVIEFYSPNTVVLRSELIAIDQRVTAIEQRLQTAGIP